jgi:ribosomal protein S18 acetylase RimI-like enzyme
MSLTIRAACASDDAALSAIDAATWSPLVGPGPGRSCGGFFSATTLPHDALVAEDDGRVLGYVQLAHPTPLASNRHVLEIHGLAVEPSHQRTGIARALLDAAATRARGSGCRKIRLRVLATNDPARGLYASTGFAVEGVLREEFLLEGRYVDDVLMALRLDDARRPAQ